MEVFPFHDHLSISNSAFSKITGHNLPVYDDKADIANTYNFISAEAPSKAFLLIYSKSSDPDASLCRNKVETKKTALNSVDYTVSYGVKK